MIPTELISEYNNHITKYVYKKYNKTLIINYNFFSSSLIFRLQTGWSSGRPNDALCPEEQAAIISVIRRNEALEMAERQRVGKLVDKVEKIKLQAAEFGPKTSKLSCRICGQSFGILGPSKLICDDCQKPVCSKCSIEINSKSPKARYVPISPRTVESSIILPSKEVWLCKICSETREMWKKSGAWFFKGLPRYELPQRSNSTRSVQRDVKPRIIKTTKLGMQIDDSSSEEEDDESKNRLGNGSRYFLSENKKSPMSQSLYTSSSESQQINDWDNISMTPSTHNRRESCLLIGNHQRRSSISSNWSMSESSSGNSSNPGVQINCKEAPLGWLELSINFNESAHTLECMILRARDLPSMDSSGLADPFCKLNIVTIEGTIRQSRWLKTKTVHKTKNPEFNETVTFIGIESDDLGSSVLYVVLLDDDKYGHDFLGAAKIMMGPVCIL